MVSILQSLSKTIHVSIGISLILFLGLYFGNGGFDFDIGFGSTTPIFYEIISDPEVDAFNEVISDLALQPELSVSSVHRFQCLQKKR